MKRFIGDIKYMFELEDIIGNPDNNVQESSIIVVHCALISRFWIFAGNALIELNLQDQFAQA